MAKSARASVVKKNKANLKKKVFGPIESARNERLNARLLELAQQGKPAREEMEVEHCKDSKDAEEAKEHADQNMDVDEGGKPQPFRSERNAAQKRQKAARVQKSTRRRKPANMMVFPKTGKAKAKERNKR